MVVSAAQAAAMPEFGPDGRNAYFGASLYWHWLESQRSGLDLRVPVNEPASIPILLSCLLLAALLPLLLRLRQHGWGASRPTPDGGQLVILLQLLAVSFGLYLLAHLLFFQLHYPNRFLRASLPLAVAVGAGHSLGVLLELLGPRLAARLAGGYRNIARRRSVHPALRRGRGARAGRHPHQVHPPRCPTLARRLTQDLLIATRTPADASRLTRAS